MAEEEQEVCVLVLLLNPVLELLVSLSVAVEEVALEGVMEVVALAHLFLVL